MDDEEIRKAAYRRWEAEGRPEGQHERHWHEAEAELKRTSTGTQTWSSDHTEGVAPPSADDEAGSDAVSSNEPGSFKPGELASENK
ncbi:DUF2934 domain-containing protein [Rhizobium sp. BE258]|uniref:DUF2934 domain-containing protein n=1 Tax=Rhizobium sp. BE258 TaxID=2817722 RepID=UPI003870C706